MSQLPALNDHPVLILGGIAGAVLLLVILGRLFWHKLKGLWAKAVQGGAILARPSQYALRVALPSFGAWLAKLGVIAVFLAGYGITVTFHTIMSVMGGNSIANSVSVTPGGVGVTQAANVAALGDVTDAATATAYSLGQQLAITAWNIVFAIVLVVWAFGWAGGKLLVEQSYVDAKGKVDEQKAQRAQSRAAKRAERGGRGGDADPRSPSLRSRARSFMRAHLVADPAAPVDALSRPGELAIKALAALPQMSILVFDRELRFALRAGDGLLTHGSVEGRTLQEVLPPPASERLEPHLRAALAGRQSTFLYEALDRERTYEVQVGPIRSDGEVVGGLVIAREVSAQRRAGGGAAEYSSDVVTRSDADGVYRYVSPSSARVYGWAPEQWWVARSATSCTPTITSGTRRSVPRCTMGRTSRARSSGSRARTGVGSGWRCTSPCCGTATGRSVRSRRRRATSPTARSQRRPGASPTSSSARRSTTRRSGWRSSRRTASGCG